tara:strand:- start:6063 stop:7259 length:1197 start_codon:yes stop_codon:yes gene_type:complete
MIPFWKKYRNLVLIGGASFFVLGLFWIMSQATPAPNTKKAPLKLDTAEDLIDPREMWTHKIETVQSETLKSLSDMQAENQTLKQELQNMMQGIKEAEAGREETALSLIGPQQNYESVETQISEIPLRMQHITLEGGIDDLEAIDTHFKNVDTYIPAGTFVHSVLLTGIVVGTGVTAQSDPQPVIIRFTDAGVIPGGHQKDFKADVKDGVLIGSCQGDISSERAFCRIHTLSLTEENGEIIESPVEGWVIGEDGRPGVRGTIVDRSSEVVRLAMINGILGGISSFFQQQATSSTYPLSPITGPQNALKGEELMKAGAYGGTHSALEKMADFAIKRAEQMQPVIVVSSGRKVDVVFKTGVNLQEASFVKRQTEKEKKSVLYAQAANSGPHQALSAKAPTF